MAEFKISRFRYNWKGVWITGTDYIKDDVVRYSGKVYVCTRQHTSSTNIYQDIEYIAPGTTTVLPAWVQMLDGVAWRGNWINSRYYQLGDLVLNGGMVYKCITPHTSASLLSTDISKWSTYLAGEAYVGDWATNLSYKVGSVVVHGGNLYEALVEHTANARFETDLVLNYWELIFSNIEYKGEWINYRRYKINDLVNYGSNVWICTTAHDGGFDAANWSIYIPGQKYVGVFDSATMMYVENDIVRHGGNLYIALGNNSLNGLTPSQDPTNWRLALEAYYFRGDWNVADTYAPGDLVRRGGNLYVALLDTVGIEPSLDPSSWEISVPGEHWRNYWTQGADYGVNDIVQFDANVYKCIISNIATDENYPANGNYSSPQWELLVQGNPANGITQRGDLTIRDKSVDGSTLKNNRVPIGRERDMLKVAPAEGAQGSITTDYITLTDPIPPEIRVKYMVNDEYRIPRNFVVGNTYIFDQSAESNVSLLLENQNVGHPLLLSVTPDGEWQGGVPYEEGVSYKLDGQDVPFEVWVDVQARNNAVKRTLSITVTASTPKTLYYYCDYHPDEGAEITIRNDGNSAWWDRFGEITKNYYVDNTKGEDIPGNGLNWQYPWKTVRYATENVSQGSQSIIRVAGGKYSEVLPIIVPAKCSIEGSELRSTVIAASEPIEALADDYQYTIAVLEHFREIIQDIITNIEITPSVGNTVVQNTSNTPGTNTSAGTVSFLMKDIIDYIQNAVDDSVAKPTVYGTNERTILDEYFHAYAILEDNKEFLAAEAIAFMQVSFPAYSFDSELCKRDVRRYIDAWKYDILYTGNYKTVLAARYYVNAIYGSSSEDMFYLRDATSLRNMTLEGLSGILAPYIQDFTAGSFIIGQSYTITSVGDTDFTAIGATANQVGIVFDATGPGTGTGTAESNVLEITRRPTAGSYSSLDPGWGPDDERTWIHTRSPYVQNCTLLGEGAVGQKIDGALHNGGNKSMVANDYTSLISDGVGAWVTNQGRAELVSVFTYYCHIGYLTENGGIIRGTNGNNSYGRFGAVASGVLDAEVPITAVINNRTEQAVIASAFAGESADEILVLEFENAGSEYTYVDYTVVGAGTGAVLVGDEFRDKAVFESRVIDPGDGNAIGGGGYTIAGNNAQAGDSLSITLASNDPNQEVDYVGMRITITSGTGTGQYGVIATYDDDTQGNTKVVTVIRESDGQYGWDHVIPGTPSRDPLDTTTFYRIEPRVAFSHPGFTSQSFDLLGSQEWNKIVFGQTVEIYPGLTGEYGTGTTVDIPPDVAEFSITKSGASYAVAISSAGAGYQTGDTITIVGTSLGGTSPTNDLVITVTEVSDDSTNSIVDFSFIGIGIGGKFVAAAKGSNVSTWSRDGETWNTASLPNGGAGSTDWAICPGTTNFVAIRSGTSVAGYSTTAESWTTTAMPSVSNWSGVAYGGGKFVAISSLGNKAAYSTNGTTWIASSMPTDVYDDSTIGDWSCIAYGKNKFVALCKTTNIAAYSANGINWTGTRITTDSTYGQWVSVTYGNGRFVAISEEQDAAAYSFDGITWYQSSLPSQDGSTAHSWVDVKYGEGVFIAVGNTGSRRVGNDVTTGPTRFIATSEDGAVWTARTLTDSRLWSAVTFGNPGKDPIWIAISANSTRVNKIRTGAQARGRVTIGSGRISKLYLWEPGSGYTSAPTVTLTDPNNTSDAVFDVRISNGVIANPTFINRGIGYRSSSTTVTVAGDGYGDIIPVGKYITITGLPAYPKLGSNITIDDLETTYVLVTYTELGGVAGAYTARFQISPVLENIDNIQHNTPITIRQQFSQVRLTGHDFLSIGVGGLVASNYPTTDLTLFAPENEVVADQGGRVFYTNSDQDGNFKVGELFTVEQASGTVTLSADFFDLNGLSELRIGGVRLGGSGTVIREFSTDPLFTADSNNVIPTQRAIKAYLTRRLTIGGSEVSTGVLTAGVTRVGPNQIDTTTGANINLPVRLTISGPRAGISGLYVAQMLFYKSFRDD